jgi:all-trans-8'-apo-beta-carotenal 15,15'-oxygenase
MFNFGVFFSSAASKLSLYHFDETGRLTRRTNHRLDCDYSIHDFSLSANYVVFYLSPYTLNVDRMVRGGYSLMDSLAWEPERGSRLLVMDRRSGEQVASVPLAGRYCLHLINSFDQGQRLTVDVIELEQPVYDQYQPLPELFTDVSRGGPIRLVVDLQKCDVIERHELDYRSAPDFPAIDPSRSGQPYRDFWMLGLSATGRKGRKFFDQLVHASWDAPSSNDIFQAAPHHYLGGEPIFIGGPEPGDGAVICQQFDADRAQSEFLVFDAFHVSAGPIATLRLKEPIYLGFHASFRGAPTSMSTT